MSRQTMALELFRDAAERVPAYKAFLKSAGVDPSRVESWDDFERLPQTSKKTYLQRYELADLCWDGSLVGQLLFSATSGSSGEPHYFPREEQLAKQYAEFMKEFLDYGSYGHKPTLVILGFGMGIWIGGVFTLEALMHAAKSMDYPLSILPTGVNKKEIMRALERLAPQFEQTLLVGYPPFVREVISDACDAGIDLEALNIRLLFAAESFNESFRDYLVTKAGIRNPMLDTLNIYGTADIGAMAYETPGSIMIRRLATERPELFGDIFNQIQKTPTLTQYDPRYMYFEEVDGEILLTGNSTTPLLRYAIGDKGGVLSHEEMEAHLERHGIDLAQELKKAGVTTWTPPNYPYVYVYERTDFSVSLYGIIIYPEYVKDAVASDELSALLSGKFSMEVKNDLDSGQTLCVHIEQRADVTVDDDQLASIKQMILAALRNKSSEFMEIYHTYGQSLVEVVAWPNGHPDHFAPGTKQHWVAKKS